MMSLNGLFLHPHRAFKATKEVTEEPNINTGQIDL